MITLLQSAKIFYSQQAVNMKPQEVKPEGRRLIDELLLSRGDVCTVRLSNDAIAGNG